MGCKGVTGRRIGRPKLATALALLGLTAWLGGSPTVNAACEPTEAETLGPYYQPDAPFTETLAAPEEPGERLVVSGYVVSRPDCSPVADAIIEVWQAAASRRDHRQPPGVQAERHLLRARLRTDLNGYYRFETVVPASYPAGGEHLRPPHIHFRISHPDYRPLTTRLYIGEAARAWDPFGAQGRIVQPERHEAARDGTPYSTVEFDLILERLPRR